MITKQCRRHTSDNLRTYNQHECHIQSVLTGRLGRQYKLRIEKGAEAPWRTTQETEKAAPINIFHTTVQLKLLYQCCKMDKMEWKFSFNQLTQQAIYQNFIEGFACT